MAATVVQNSIEIPDGVNLSLEGKRITLEGENGQVVKDFSHARLEMEHKDSTIRVWVVNPRKKDAALVNTLIAHVRNMIKGVTEGFTYKLKIVFVHFPMTVRVQGKRLIIQNFIGERQDRYADITENVNVTIKGEDVIVEGADIEKVAQTSANIQQACKIRRKDLRKFLDGIYVYSKE